MRLFEEFNSLRLDDVPGTSGLPFLIDGPRKDVVMAPGLTRVLTLRRVVGQIADLGASWTISFVTVVRVLVVARRRPLARQVALGWLGLPRPAARHLNDGARASTLEAGF